MFFIPMHKQTARNVTIITGNSYGHEGKSKILNCLGKYANIIVRSPSRNYVCQTISKGDKEFTLKIIPPEIVDGKTVVVIGSGAEVDPSVIIRDLQELNRYGFKITSSNLKISTNAIFTKLHDGKTSKTVEHTEKMKIAASHFADGSYELELMILKNDLEMDDSMYHACKISCRIYKQRLSQFICDTQLFLRNAIDYGKDTIFEEKESFLLDLTEEPQKYPMPLISSQPSRCLGPMQHIQYSIGVFKAYTSKEGGGSFPTELTGHQGEVIQKMSNEPKANTQEPTRYGWLDLVQVRHAMMVNSQNCLAINHMDTIGKVGLELGEIKVCTAYQYQNEMDFTHEAMFYVPSDLKNITPIYSDAIFKGWTIPEDCKDFDSLPEEAKRFITFIEQSLQTPIAFIGTGPNLDDLIVREDPQSYMYQMLQSQNP